MSLRTQLVSVGLVLVMAACSEAPTGGDAGTGGGAAAGGGTGSTPDAGPATEFSYCQGKSGPTLSFAPGQEQAIQTAVNTLAECSTVKLAAGTYTFTNALTIRKKGISLIGAGKGRQGELTATPTVTPTSTVLVFTGAAANTNGVDHVGDHFTIRGLAIINARKDALRIESSTNVKIQFVRTEWANQNSGDNGKYGIYPVKSTNVLIEDCEAYNAADAAIYVGQTTSAIVRRNVAKQNVAGIEIENTRFADVYGNLAEDNTCGLVVFDLPGNPIRGEGIKLHDNVIQKNNRANFAAISASSSTVSQVPAGTGTFVLASRRVELTRNTYLDNNSVDVAVLSGLSIEPDPAQWGAAGFNWGSSDVWVHDNTFSGGSGQAVDNGNFSPTLRPLGLVLAGLYQVQAMLVPDGGGIVDPLIWDGVDPQGADNLGNDINLCFTGNILPTGAKAPLYGVADLNFPGSTPLLQSSNPADQAKAYGKTGHYAQGAAPYNCTGFVPALAPVVLPQ